MLSLVYSLVFTLGFLLVLPYGIYQFVRHGKYKTSFLKRLGVGFPKIVNKKGPIIWVHAVSVGECQAILRLVNCLQAEVPNASIVISSITETGHEEVKRLFPKAAAHIYMPFDFAVCMKHAFRQCKPDLIVLAEGDFWFHFLKEAKKHNCPVVVVNGKVSEQSAKRFATFHAFTKELFSPIKLFCLQSELYKERFLSLGVEPEKLLVTGNLKGDAQVTPISEAEREELKAKLAIQPEDFVTVAGSTHDPEEELLIKALMPDLLKNPHLKLLLIPRHPERFSEVVALVEKHNIPFGSWTKGSTSQNPQIIVVDAMGVLRKLYQIADLAVVAGSFTEKVGGHNILEAQVFGVPVVVGPHMRAQQALLDASLAASAICQVTNDTLRSELQQLIVNSDRRKELSRNSIKLANALTGATEHTFDAIKTYLVKKG